MESTVGLWDEPAIRRWPLIRSLSTRPRIGDALAIAFCTIPVLTALVIAPPAHAWLGYVSVLGVALALWWRRSQPILIGVIVAILATFNPISAHGTTVAFFETIVMFYTIAAYRPLPKAVGGCALVETILFVGAGITLSLGWRDTWPYMFFQPLSLAAFAMGLAVRSSRMRRKTIEELVVMREERAGAAERTRIAAEMHDVVAHSVTVMVALAGGASSAWEKHPQRARQALDQLVNVGGDALGEMQRILRLLRDNDAKLDESLEKTGHNIQPIEELVKLFCDAGLPVFLTIDPQYNQWAPIYRTTVHHIVKEALTNTLRYASQATYVEVSVQCDRQKLTINVTDNGAATPTVSVGTGQGLRAIRERAVAFGGSFDAGPLLQSKGMPGSGWNVHVTLPKDT